MEAAGTFFSAMEIVGIVSFSISGSMTAIRKGLDLLGVVIIGIVTAMGGGILRDLFIGNVPPLFFTDLRYPVIATAVSALTFLAAFLLKPLYSRSQAQVEMINNVFDAIGLSFFTIAGVNVGLSSPYSGNMFLMIFLGVVTGVGGGMTRDIMTGEIPIILKKHIYALASLTGSGLYCLLLYAKLSRSASVVAALLAIFAIRIFATAFKWNLPRIRFN